MKIELKSIKFYSSMSEETFCYEGVVWVDGQKIGRVSNDGHGGSDRQDFSWAEVQRLEASLPEGKSLEEICHDAVAAHIAQKDFNKDIKKKAVFTLPNEPGVFELGYKGAPPDDKLFLTVQARYPGAQILNLMAPADALMIYTEARFG